jgi:hypothetical protein
MVLTVPIVSTNTGSYGGAIDGWDGIECCDWSVLRPHTLF